MTDPELDTLPRRVGGGLAAPGPWLGSAVACIRGFAARGTAGLGRVRVSRTSPSVCRAWPENCGSLTPA